MLSCSVGNIISDHAPVFLEMSGKVQRPQWQWRFPNHLKNPAYKLYVTEQFHQFISENDTPDVSPNLLWETAKAVIRGFTMSFSSNLKKQQRAKQQCLKSQLSKLQGEFILNPSEDLIRQIDATTTALDTLLSTEAQRSILFAKHNLYESGNKSIKYLANLVKERAGSQAIPVIKDNFGNRVYKDRDINNSFLEFYHCLYKSESDCDSKDLMDNFFSVINPC